MSTTRARSAAIKAGSRTRSGAEHRSRSPITRVALAFASVESDPDKAHVNLRALAEPDALELETNESTLLIAITAGALLGELEVTLRVGRGFWT